MPHLIIEYSMNLEPHIDVAQLVSSVHVAAQATEIFQRATIRTRAVGHAHYCVGEGSPKDAFVHISARIRPGRSENLQWGLSETLLDVLKEQLKNTFLVLRVGLTVEVDLIRPIRTLYSTLDTEGEIISLGR